VKVKYLALKYKMNDDRFSAVLFGHIRVGSPDTFYHWYGPSRMSMPKTVVILKTYGTVEHDDNDAIDEFTIQYAHDFAWPIGVKASAGWLARDGTYYPCRSWEHDTAAEMIAIKEFGKAYFETYSTATCQLENKGWIRLYNNGIPGVKDDRTFVPSQAQLDTLMDITMQEDCSEEMRENIMSDIEYWAEQEVT
jgi:hypothetical protein